MNCMGKSVYTHRRTYVRMSPVSHTERMQLTFLKMCVIMCVIIIQCKNAVLSL